MFLLWLRQLPRCRDRFPASVPPSTEGKSNPTYIPLFLPNSFVLTSFAWFYIFFSIDQILLSTLSWCSAYTSVSEVVFLMYLWREVYSTSPYSSAIFQLQRQDTVNSKKNTHCESWVKSYLGQSEDYSPGDSTSDSSEKLLQRGRGEGQYIPNFGERGMHAIQQIFFAEAFY